MRIRHPKDFFTGGMFLLFGVGAMVLARQYPIGTAARMGPGYFPFLLGLLLGGLGAWLLGKDILGSGESEQAPSFHWKPLGLVLSSVVLFGLLLRPVGLLGSTLLLVLLSSLGSHEFRLKEALLNAAVLVFIILLVFVYFLEFQVPVWPSFPALRS